MVKYIKTRFLLAQISSQLVFGFLGSFLVESWRHFCWLSRHQQRRLSPPGPGDTLPIVAVLLGHLEQQDFRKV